MRRFKWIDWNLSKAEQVPDILADLEDPTIFVITAY